MTSKITEDLCFNNILHKIEGYMLLLALIILMRFYGIKPLIVLNISLLQQTWMDVELALGSYKNIHSVPVIT